MLVDKLESGTIIWDADFMDMPKLADRSEDQTGDMFRYLTTWPLESAELMATRLYAAYFYQRSDYSLAHRVFLLVVIPGVLLLALVGLVTAIRRRNSTDYLLPTSLILAQSAVIAISFADHDHRFISYIMSLTISVYRFWCHRCLARRSIYSPFKLIPNTDMRTHKALSSRIIARWNVPPTIYFTNYT